MPRDTNKIDYMLDAREASCDTECFPNYWNIGFENIETGKQVILEHYEGNPLDRQRLRTILETYRIYTFNGLHYDIPMICLALQGADNAKLKRCNDDIIVKLDQMNWWLRDAETGAAGEFRELDATIGIPALRSEPVAVKLTANAPGKIDADITAGHLNLIAALAEIFPQRLLQFVPRALSIREIHVVDPLQSRVERRLGQQQRDYRLSPG